MTRPDADPLAPEADPHASWGDRTPLEDENGRLILVFTLSTSTRDGRPWADSAWRPGGVPACDAAEMALTTFPGHAFSTSDPELVACLGAAGATIVRRAHVMTHALEALPVIPPMTNDLRVEPLSAAKLELLADRLALTHLAAYPAGHPDHEHSEPDTAAAELRSIAEGELLGPFLPQSQVAMRRDESVGACLLVARDGAPPDGGPWVIDVFRDPSTAPRGLGFDLLSAGLYAVAAAGMPGLSLAVTSANTRARRVYTRLGFIDTSQAWTLLLS